MRIFHPDNFASATQEEQDEAASNAAALNRARETLSSPLERARYFLSLKNFPIEETDSLEDDDFIDEIFDKRAAIEENCKNVEALKQLLRDNEANISELFERLLPQFQGEKYSEAKDLVHRIIYYEKIRFEIKQRLPIN